MVNGHLDHIKKMYMEADDISKSVSFLILLSYGQKADVIGEVKPLLDLKQRCAGVFDARFAREQAASITCISFFYPLFTVFILLSILLRFSQFLFYIGLCVKISEPVTTFHICNRVP